MGYFDDNNWWNTHVKPITGSIFQPNDWLPSSGADPQDFIYLETMPGSFSRRMSTQRVCDPLWPVLGCKTSVDGSHTEIVPGYELPYQFQTEDEDEDGDESDEELECKTSDCPPNHIAIKITDADGNETCSCQDTEALGDGITSIGRGLGILALAGVATTGIIVYGIYRVIRG